MNGQDVVQTRNLKTPGSHFRTANGESAQWYNWSYPDSQVTSSYRTSPQAVSFTDEAAVFAKVLQPSRVVASSSYDTGHEFSTVRSRLLKTTHLDGLSFTLPGYDIRVYGDAAFVGSSLVGIVGDPRIAKVDPLSTNEILVYGSRAINATAPTKPEAGVSQLLGELKRDGIPNLPGYELIHKQSLKNLGSSYLNYEFGIVPLVSDVKKLLHSVVKSSEILQQFRRDSGRIVRRSFTFPSERIVDRQEGLQQVDSSYPTYHGVLSPAVFKDMGMGYDVTTVTKRKLYFKGAFSYYLDVGDSLVSKAKRFEQEANRLLGLRLTPDVLYDLAPWSWLLDWYTTIGTSLSNVSMLQEDGLVIRYGYLMCHTVADRTIQGTPTFKGWDKPFPISTTFRTERKERFKATPYGFGLDIADFDLRKWAILGALGMTLAPGKMR